MTFKWSHCYYHLTGRPLATLASAIRSEARGDVRVTGFWGRRQDAFFDVRVFHPNAPSYLRTQPASL